MMFGEPIDVMYPNGRTMEDAINNDISGEPVKSMIEIPPTGIGDLSDGYHTFNQLYHQRAILFAVIVNQNPSVAWKSLKHEDGKYCFDSDGEWFIVGIDTPKGPYTYHYERRYWNLFKCRELPVARHWDGHTEEDVIRLLSLCKGGIEYEERNNNNS